MGKNLKFRVPDDPSAIARPKISNVETFCLGCKDSVPEIESRWDERRRLDFYNDRRCLECLKQWEW